MAVCYPWNVPVVVRPVQPRWRAKAEGRHETSHWLHISSGFVVGANVLRRRLGIQECIDTNLAYPDRQRAAVMRRKVVAMVFPSKTPTPLSYHVQASGVGDYARAVYPTFPKHYTLLAYDTEEVSCA